MSASSIFTAIASSAVCGKLSTQSQIHLSNVFSSKPKFPKPIKLKTQIQSKPLPFSFLCSPHDLRRFSAGFDAFEASGDDDDEQGGEDPEAEEDPIEEEGEEEEGKGTQSSGEEGRLYVGNLPYAMTSSELAEVFGEAGNVVDVQIVYDRVTDRSRGFAFVSMGSNGEAKEAIRMFEGSQIGGRTVKVNFPEVPRGGERAIMGPKIRDSYRSFIDSPHKIYAGNLGWRLTSQGLRAAFADQPGLLSAKVIYDRDSGKSRGFGFVSFESAEDAQSALNAMNGMEVEGRPLRLNLAAERPHAARPLDVERDTEENRDSTELVSSTTK